MQLNVDAVVPDALGGSHKDPANLVTACETCNGGKSSSSPDAPLVADVADRALEWAQAMKQVQAKMHADMEARGRDQAQFETWWNSWQIKATGTPVPMDPGWWVTVNQLVTAGLPIATLKECIDLAMTQRKVKDENRFRYMCGIAWNKVTEMQKAARAVTSGEPVGEISATVDRYEQGRIDVARELLDEISDEERAHFLDAADLTGWQEEPQTEAELTYDAVSSLINSARCSVDWLVEHIRKTLGNLPPVIGQSCLAAMTADETLGDPIARMAWQGVNAMRALEDLIDFPAVVTRFNALPEDERREWLEFAYELYPDPDLGSERLIARAMKCAKVTEDGNTYNVMCCGIGTHIPACPSRGVYRAFLDGLECCGPDHADDHEGHLVCERHLEQLMDGTFTGRSGKVYGAIDFTVIPEPDPAPF